MGDSRSVAKAPCGQDRPRIGQWTCLGSVRMGTHRRPRTAIASFTDGSGKRCRITVFSHVVLYGIPSSAQPSAAARSLGREECASGPLAPTLASERRSTFECRSTVRWRSARGRRWSGRTRTGHHCQRQRVASRSTGHAGGTPVPGVAGSI